MSPLRLVSLTLALARISSLRMVTCSCLIAKWTHVSLPVSSHIINHISREHTHQIINSNVTTTPIPNRGRYFNPNNPNNPDNPDNDPSGELTSLMNIYLYSFL